jgi:hypothetical protein
MELALIAVNALVSIAALVVALRKRHDAKEVALKRIADEAVAYAKAKPQPGIPPERVALEAAILSDMKDNGKRDFADGQLLVAIRARLA